MATKGTLKYRKVTRTPQSGPNKNKQMYYATAVTDREMNFEEFVTHISEHNSPYSRGTVHGVLMDTLDCLQELILDGKSVRLSDLGLFSIGMTSRAELPRTRYRQRAWRAYTSSCATPRLGATLNCARNAA